MTHPVAAVTAADVTAGLRALGVGNGDTVFFHSSLKSMGHVVGGAGKPHDGAASGDGVRHTRAEGAEAVTEGLGELLRDEGTYQRATIGEATVYCARLKPLLGRMLEITLGDPRRWLSPAFCDWMGEPPDPHALLARYASAGGVPPDQEDRDTCRDSV